MLQICRRSLASQGKSLEYGSLISKLHSNVQRSLCHVARQSNQDKWGKRYSQTLFQRFRRRVTLTFPPYTSGLKVGVESKRLSH
eukprot:g27830.t1